MRARYTAYATGNVDFILSSTRSGDGGRGRSRPTPKRGRKSAEWLGLEITATEAGQPSDETGLVEFVAKYKIRGVSIDHRERATFKKTGKGWVFVDGVELKGPPVRNEGPKAGS